MAFSHNSPATITTRCSCVVPAPPDEVYALLIDRERMRSLQPLRTEEISIEELPNGLHASHRRTYLPSGAALDTHARGVERVENRRVVNRATQTPAALARYSHLRFGSIEFETSCSLQATGAGTAATLKVEWRFAPLPLHLFVSLFLRDRLLRKSEGQLQRVREPFLNWPTRGSEPSSAQRQ